MPLMSRGEVAQVDMLYFELLHINPIKANLSFMTIPDDDDDGQMKSAQARFLHFSNSCHSHLPLHYLTSPPLSIEPSSFCHSWKSKTLSLIPKP